MSQNYICPSPLFHSPYYGHDNSSFKVFDRHKRGDDEIKQIQGGSTISNRPRATHRSKWRGWGKNTVNTWPGVGRPPPNDRIRWGVVSKKIYVLLSAWETIKFTSTQYRHRWWRSVDADPRKLLQSFVKNNKVKIMAASHVMVYL